MNDVQSKFVFFNFFFICTEHILVTIIILSITLLNDCFNLVLDVYGRNSLFRRHYCLLEILHRESSSWFKRGLWIWGGANSSLILIIHNKLAHLILGKSTTLESGQFFITDIVNVTKDICKVVLMILNWLSRKGLHPLHIVALVSLVLIYDQFRIFFLVIHKRLFSPIHQAEWVIFIIIFEKYRTFLCFLVLITTKPL